jgi:Carboxypeptidase regulatory-like domain
MKSKLQGLTILLFALLLSLTLSAQVQNGNITGTVTDPSGAVVPNATVTATSTTTGLTRTTKTASNGAYTINNLPPGPYQVKTNATGFGPFTGQTVVSVGGTSTLDAKMQLQGSSTQSR